MANDCDFIEELPFGLPGGFMQEECTRNNSRLLLSISFTGLVLAVTLAPVQAQVGTASLGGLVTDPTGATIRQATVTLESVTQKYSRSTATNTAGEFKIPALPPGDYKLLISKSGFSPATETGISLTSGQASTLDVRLTVAGSSQQVTV